MRYAIVKKTWFYYYFYRAQTKWSLCEGNVFTRDLRRGWGGYLYSPPVERQVDRWTLMLRNKLRDIPSYWGTSGDSNCVLKKINTFLNVLFFKVWLCYLVWSFPKYVTRWVIISHSNLPNNICLSYRIVNHFKYVNM